MDAVTKIITSGTHVIYTASSVIAITRLSISNPSSSATIRVSKRVNGSDISIDAYDMTLASGSVNIITDKIILKTQWSLVIVTNQTVHVDVNIE